MSVKPPTLKDFIQLVMYGSLMPLGVYKEYVAAAIIMGALYIGAILEERN